MPRVDKQHDSSRPCPSGGESRHSTHEVCFGGRVYSDKGRGADGCYDRTDKSCTTGNSYPSAHSNSRGEGRGGSGNSTGSSVNIGSVSQPSQSSKFASYFTQSGGFSFSLVKPPSVMKATLKGMTGHYNNLSEQAKVVARELDCPSYSGGILNFNQMQINTSNMDRCVSMNDIAAVIRAKAREG